MTGVGRVCGVSDSSAPSSDDSAARRARGSTSRISSQNARQRMLGSMPAHEHHVVVRARRPAHREPGGRPLDPPGHAVDQRDRRPVDLEVVVVVRVDRGQRLGVPDQLEVLHARRWRASPASFHPSKAATSTGAVSSGQSSNSFTRPAYDRPGAGSAGRRSICGRPAAPVDDQREGSPAHRYPFRPCPPSVRVALPDHPPPASGGRRRRDGHHAAGRTTSTLDDFEGLEGCNEILNVTRPDVVRARPRRLLRGRRATASRPTPSAPTSPTSASTTSPTGSTSWPRPAPGWPARSPTAASHAGPAALGARLDRARAPSCPPSATRRTRRCATPTSEQAAGLLAGGADAVLVETCQDLLQAKARSSAPSGRWPRPASTCR